MLTALTTARAADAIPTPPVGASAPDFKLPGVDGKKHALKDFKKSPVVKSLHEDCFK